MVKSYYKDIDCYYVIKRYDKDIDCYYVPIEGYWAEGVGIKCVGYLGSFLASEEVRNLYDKWCEGRWEEISNKEE